MKERTTQVLLAMVVLLLLALLVRPSLTISPAYAQGGGGGGAGHSAAATAASGERVVISNGIEALVINPFGNDNRGLPVGVALSRHRLNQQ
jgi:hypothetical protein